MREAKTLERLCVSSEPLLLGKAISRVISSPEYGCPIHLHAKIKILMGHLEKKMGPRNLNIHLTAK